jgi:hypothetical protein
MTPLFPDDQPFFELVVDGNLMFPDAWMKAWRRVMGGNRSPLQQISRIWEKA